MQRWYADQLDAQRQLEMSNAPCRGQPGTDPPGWRCAQHPPAAADLAPPLVHPARTGRNPAAAARRAAAEWQLPRQDWPAAARAAAMQAACCWGCCQEAATRLWWLLGASQQQTLSHPAQRPGPQRTAGRCRRRHHLSVSGCRNRSRLLRMRSRCWWRCQMRCYLVAVLWPPACPLLPLRWPAAGLWVAGR